jgi:hypothetical protein
MESVHTVDSDFEYFEYFTGQSVDGSTGCTGSCSGAAAMVCVNAGESSSLSSSVEVDFAGDETLFTGGAGQTQGIVRESIWAPACACTCVVGQDYEPNVQENRVCLFFRNNTISHTL